MGAVGTEAVVPLNRHPEVELREQLEGGGDAAALAALDRVEAARDEVAEASTPDELLAALDSFDSLIEELTGEPPAPAEDGAEGGRTPLYLDCMRELEVDLGPSFVAELATGLPLSARGIAVVVRTELRAGPRDHRGRPVGYGRQRSPRAAVRKDLQRVVGAPSPPGS